MVLVLWFFEFGYLLQHIATIFQIHKIQSSRNTEGISLETNVFFLLASVCRIIWMWDSMLATFYLTYLELLIGLASLVYIIKIYIQFSSGYDYLTVESEKPIYLNFYVILVAIFVLSFFFHPGSKNDYYLSLQMFVSMNIFSECLGLLPQFFIIVKSKESGNLSAYYIIFLAVARFFRLFFWIKMYIDGSKFMSLIIADVLHTGFLSVFIYSASKKWYNTSIPQFNPEADRKKKVF